MSDCPFCLTPPDDIIAVEGPCYAIFDRFPVTDLHALIIPRRHVASLQELTGEEWAAVLPLARKLAEQLRKQDDRIEGFNLGINDGAVAGQTVPHVHVHWIPRRKGDVPRPQGGVRWIFPDKADYTSASA
jgi:diadenosine tetraphosphate (Ap4A) HIT family hydrolase